MRAVVIMMLLMVQTVVALPVFPGAEGFGSETVAGRGGQVLLVTNLQDSGTGSLRRCVEESGPRVCVFTISGTIVLQSNLLITNPYLTIAGQTAPEPGVVVRGYTTIVRTNDVLIQHMRFRAGAEDAPDNYHLWGAHDALEVSEGARNVVVDHVSASWGVDEVVSLFDITRTTISNSIIAEGLKKSKHPKQDHSKGLMIASNAKEISAFRNVIAHNSDRNPMHSSSESETINNIIYNWGREGNGFIARQKKDLNGNILDPFKVTAIGNAFMDGPDTPQNKLPFVINENDDFILTTESQLYLEDNSNDGVVAANQWLLVTLDVADTSKVVPADTPPTSSNTITILPNRDVPTIVDSVGAWPAHRDSVDTRIIQDVENGLAGSPTGHLVNCVSLEPTNPDCDESTEHAGGWPVIPVTVHDLDTLPDPIPSESERDIIQPSGYTALEEWIHRRSEIAEGTSTSKESCTDGTAYGTCSTTLPLFCSDGTLIDDCITCGCAVGFTCQSDGLCVGSDSCTDNDLDGYGDPASGSCTFPDLDCDDSNANVHTEIACTYDGNSCGTYSLCLESCPAPPAEVCDGVDNNCDGVIDEGCNVGDFDGNGAVDINDFRLIVNNYKKNGPGDLNGDTLIDIIDLAIFGSVFQPNIDS